jgi:hypothetical protein
MSLSWALPFDQIGRRSTVPRDTSRTPPRIPGWQRLLTRLGPLSTDFSYSQNSTHNRITGTPSFFYLTGLSANPGLAGDSTGRVRQQFGNVSAEGTNWRTAGRTTLALGLGASLQTRGEFSATRGIANGLTTRSTRLQFPDLDVNYGKVAETIRLGKLLTNAQLRTAYNHYRSTEYANSPTPTNISSGSDWRPLIGLSGDLRNGTRAELRIERRTTETQFRQLGNSITTESNTDVNLSLNRTYSKGQKVQFLGKETTVRTSVTMGLTAAYSRRDGETRQEGVDRPQFPVSEDRLSVNARGSYAFSSNVTGNLELGFGQTRDLQLDFVRRNVRVELRAQFTF